MKIGVVGVLGYQGRKHAVELLDLDVEVVTCDVRGNVRYRDYTEMKSLDGVVVAAPNEKHIETGEWFIRKSIPVLMEKPLAKRYAEAKEMLDFAKAKQIVLATGSIFSFNNSVKAAGEIIKEGLLGKLEFVKCSWCSQMEPWAEKDILLDLGPHPFDILCSWNLEPLGYSSNTIADGRHMLIFTLPIVGLTDIEVKLSWVEGPKRREVKVVGEEYILVVDVLNQDVLVYEGNELIAQKVHDSVLCKKGFDEYLQFSRNNTLRDELKDFLRQIKGEPDYRLAEQGVRFLKWKESRGGEL